MPSWHGRIAVAPLSLESPDVVAGTILALFQPQVPACRRIRAMLVQSVDDSSKPPAQVQCGRLGGWSGLGDGGALLSFA